MKLNVLIKTVLPKIHLTNLPPKKLYIETLSDQQSSILLKASAIHTDSLIYLPPNKPPATQSKKTNQTIILISPSRINSNC